MEKPPTPVLEFRRSSKQTDGIQIRRVNTAEFSVHNAINSLSDPATPLARPKTSTGQRNATFLSSTLSSKPQRAGTASISAAHGTRNAFSGAARPRSSQLRFPAARRSSDEFTAAADGTELPLEHSVAEDYDCIINSVEKLLEVTTGVDARYQVQVIRRSAESIAAIQTQTFADLQQAQVRIRHLEQLFVDRQREVDRLNEQLAASPWHALAVQGIEKAAASRPSTAGPITPTVHRPPSTTYISPVEEFEKPIAEFEKDPEGFRAKHGVTTTTEPEEISIPCDEATSTTATTLTQVTKATGEQRVRSAASRQTPLDESIPPSEAGSLSPRHNHRYNSRPYSANSSIASPSASPSMRSASYQKLTSPKRVGPPNASNCFIPFEGKDYPLVAQLVYAFRHGEGDTIAGLHEVPDYVAAEIRQLMHQEHLGDIGDLLVKEIPCTICMKHMVDTRLLPFKRRERLTFLRHRPRGLVHYLTSTFGNDAFPCHVSSTYGNEQGGCGNGKHNILPDPNMLSPPFFLSNNEQDAWVEVSFAPWVIVPTAYSIASHHPIGVGHAPRNWVFEGWSAADNDWIVLCSHVNDGSICAAKNFGMWELNNERRAVFWRFRLRLTGPNILNANRLQVAALEIYGRALTIKDGPTNTADGSYFGAGNPVNPPDRINPCPLPKDLPANPPAPPKKKGKGKGKKKK